MKAGSESSLVLYGGAKDELRGDSLNVMQRRWPWVQQEERTQSGLLLFVQLKTGELILLGEFAAMASAVDVNMDFYFETDFFISSSFWAATRVRS